MLSNYYVEGTLHVFLNILTTDHLPHFLGEKIRLRDVNPLLRLSLGVSFKSRAFPTTLN